MNITNSLNLNEKYCEIPNEHFATTFNFPSFVLGASITFNVDKVSVTYIKDTIPNADFKMYWKSFFYYFINVLLKILTDRILTTPPK